MNRENNTLVLNKISQALNQILNKSNFSDSLKEYKIAEIIEVELKIIPNQTDINLIETQNREVLMESEAACNRNFAQCPTGEHPDGDCWHLVIC